MDIKNRILILISLSIFSLTLYSAENKTAESDVKNQDGNKIVQENETSKDIIRDASDNVEALEKPSGSGLRQKKLSNAFEQFIPSEQISADNAVPFPVDI